MTNTTFSEVIDSEWGMYFLADEWSPVGECPTDDDDDMGVSRALLTGFLGMRSPWSGTILCGTKEGPVRLTVEVHDSPVPIENIGNVWSEVAEVAFQVRSGVVTFRRWGGETITTLELLPPGPWRLRAHANGRDEGHDQRSHSALIGEPLEEHLIQFWPGPDYGNLVLTRDRFGASLRGELTQ